MGVELAQRWPKWLQMMKLPMLSPAGCRTDLDIAVHSQQGVDVQNLIPATPRLLILPHLRPHQLPFQ
jgi:hypothetical protein